MSNWIKGLFQSEDTDNIEKTEETKTFEYPRNQKLGLTENEYKFLVALVDNGNRKFIFQPENIKYRDEALEIAISNCDYLRIDYKILTFKKLYGFTLDEIIRNRRKKKKLSSCAICGVLRRKAINYAGRLVNADKIATAHTLDDEVQTILLNLFHGDINRLTKGGPVSMVVNQCFIQKVKPFCEILEKESAL